MTHVRIHNDDAVIKEYTTGPTKRQRYLRIEYEKYR